DFYQTQAVANPCGLDPEYKCESGRRRLLQTGSGLRMRHGYNVGPTAQEQLSSTSSNENLISTSVGCECWKKGVVISIISTANMIVGNVLLKKKGRKAMLTSIIYVSYI
ncbi:unnamed protein product, partial [Anisakis simplex]|uniref:Ovule protein n=1 Tax=Anisakis simplex TaxID=6269 RepID=A0A0M3J1H2_ANISI